MSCNNNQKADMKQQNQSYFLYEAAVMVSRDAYGSGRSRWSSHRVGELKQ